MNTTKEIVSFEGVIITVAQATVLMGYRRSQLRLEAAAVNEEDFERAALRSLLYPDLIAAVVSVEGLPWPLPFEAWLALPDELVGAWEEVTYRLNPHWSGNKNEAEITVETEHYISRFTQIHKRRKEQAQLPPELPEQVKLYQPELAFQIFQLLELTDWRWPVDVLLQQPELLMADILKMSELDSKTKKMVDG